jgi:uncharacterized protein (TIGR02246 family)
MRKFFAVMLAMFCLATPAFAQNTEIQKGNAQWVELFKKGNFQALAELYTEDAQAFPPEAAIVKGRAAIATMWKEMADQVVDPELNTLEVKRLGPTAAREIGSFRLKSKGTDPDEITGKYVVLWEKVKGQWKISTDIWNSGQ